MLTETTKQDLLLNIKNFLWDWSNRGCYNKPMSTFVEIKFKEKFRELGVYNPLLYYLEQEWISFIGYGKIAMTDHHYTDHGLSRPFRHQPAYAVYHKNHIQNQTYNIKYHYTDMTALLFSSWLLEHVIKERVRSDDLVSKLSTQCAMRAWVGLQDSWRVKGSKTFWCDMNASWQDGKSDSVCTGIQVHKDEEDWLQDDLHPSGTTPDNKPVQVI